ncbi:LOW QUALITY PROTEIN: exonuclease mut-7 homolog [Rhinatrema bivittatum]|uniref:LOW QUALITY PROTEIN: exonuclease mut-7 homolog n=1 Tax=Rhinatrema bivittatum TaxID=194408 RepID=UPI00112EF940|nr:LOW QUALITY PROTEIN: exonuclease mut-7 homolog [Rhinatrema bivittatum]
MSCETGDSLEAMDRECSLRSKTGEQSPLQLMNTLKNIWAKREIEEQLRKQARVGFAGLEDPLTGLLDMLEGCSEWKGKGHSLGYCIVNEFQQWIKDHPSVQQSGLRLKKLQARIFRVLTEHIHLLDSLINIYQLHSADRNYLLGHVSHLYHMGLYKEAVILSMKLNLQLDQDLEKMCTPLLLQDKTNLIEAYVADHPELQRKLLQILDSWSDPTFNFRDIARQYQPLPHLRMDKLNHKGLSKLVFRLLEQYDLDPALCPNVINQRHLGTLKYLFYKRFVEKTMTQENWTDHIQSTVGAESWLQEQLMDLLLRYCDLETVAWWAVYYSLPKESLPYGVAEECRTSEYRRGYSANRNANQGVKTIIEESKNSNINFIIHLGTNDIARNSVHKVQEWAQMNTRKKGIDLQKFSFTKAAEELRTLGPVASESITGEMEGLEAEALVLSPQAAIAHTPSLSDLPTKAMLRDWFIELRSEMKQHKDDLLTSFSELQEDLLALGQHVDDIDNRVDCHSTAIATLTQHKSELQSEMSLLSEKLEDIENRSRRFNIRLWGIPETAENADTMREGVTYRLKTEKEARMVFQQIGFEISLPPQTTATSNTSMDLVPKWRQVKRSKCHAAKKLQQDLNNMLEGNNELDDFQEERKKSYYQFPIPRENVHFLQSWEETEWCRKEVLKPGQVVGLDMEWRPSFGMVGRPRVSLLQIAVKEHVFLLDLLQFLKEAGQEEEGGQLTDFIQTVFCDPGITKLGYGMAGDLHSLAVTYPALKGLDKKVQGMVDLLNVHKKLQKCKVGRAEGSRKVDVLPDEEERRVRQPEKGLSLLVQHVLGKPLDKTQQLSNWEKRPLREEQLIYAACDAYCLLEVFAALCEDPARFGLTVNLKDCLAEKQHQSKQEGPPASGKSSPCAKEKALVPPPPSSPQEVSMVCDNMLQGLGRYLRCLGVDVKMLENDDDHRKAAEIAREEGRVILTCGLPYQTLRSQVGEGKCFLVNCSEKAKEQAIKVLKHFNIRVTVGDIFSRCQACNCNKYLKISQEKMRKLMQHHRYLKERSTPVVETDPKDDHNKSSSSQAEHSDIPEPSLDLPQDFIYSPTCQRSDDLALGKDPLALENGAFLQLEAIPLGLLEKVSLFYCCSQCGKVFWEGSHFGRVVSQFKEVLYDTEGERFYELNAKETAH